VAVTVPLFPLFLAATYFILSLDDASTFTEPLTRSHALHLTVTIFATVGFGDITPQTEATRMVVRAQMLLDLILLGIRVILGAVRQQGRLRREGRLNRPASRTRRAGRDMAAIVSLAVGCSCTTPERRPGRPSHLPIPAPSGEI
jgi:hypothetical protein